MPAKRQWTPTQDRRIAASRLLRRPWERIAADLGASRSAVIDRARLLGIPPLPPLPPAPVEDPNRDPMPTGHPVAWAVLTAGTALADTPFEPLHRRADRARKDD